MIFLWFWCSDPIHLWIWFIFAGSSGYLVGFYSYMERCMGCKRWRFLVLCACLWISYRLMCKLLIWSSNHMGCRYRALLAASIISYLGTFTLSGLLYYWFNPSGESCSLNLFFITMTLILAVGFCIVTFHPKVLLAMFLSML